MKQTNTKYNPSPSFPHGFSVERNKRQIKYQNNATLLQLKKPTFFVLKDRHFFHLDSPKQRKTLQLCVCSIACHGFKLTITMLHNPSRDFQCGSIWGP